MKLFLIKIGGWDRGFFFKWLFHSIPLAIFSVLVISMILSLQGSITKEILDKVEFNILGKAAMWLFEHQLKIALQALIILIIGMIPLYIFRSIFPVLSNSKLVYIKHIVFDHLAESLTIMAASLFTLGFYLFEHSKLQFAWLGFIGYIIITLFTFTTSYVYYCLIKNEEEIQKKINTTMKNPLLKTGNYLTQQGNKL
jgi:hypothetical protein